MLPLTQPKHGCAGGARAPFRRGCPLGDTVPPGSSGSPRAGTRSLRKRRGRTQVKLAASIGCAGSTEAGRGLGVTSGRRGRNDEAQGRQESAGSRAIPGPCGYFLGPLLPRPGGERTRQ